MKKIMLISLLLSFSQATFALTLKGKVTDSEGKAIVGASVSSNRGRHRSRTQRGGKFLLMVNERPSSRRSKQISDKGAELVLTATKKGYASGSLTVDRSKTTGLHIKLSKGDDSSEAVSTSDSSNTYKLTYAADWKRIVIGTFVNDKLVKEDVITQSQNKTPHATGDLKPSWSKDGRYIAFMRSFKGNADGNGGQICTAMVDVKTREVTMVTEGDVEEYHPSWMRDGSHRVIINRHIYANEWTGLIVDPKKGQSYEQRVPHGMMPNTALKDGTLLCGAMGFGLWAHNLDKKWGHAKRVQLDKPFPANVLLTTPSVSPDESKVVFAVDFSKFTGTYAGVKFVPDHDYYDYPEKLIYMGDLDMRKLTITNIENITAQKKDTSYGVGYPRWSPDGTRIVYHSTINGPFAVALYDLRTKTTKIITDKTTNRGYPCFQYAPM